MNLKMTTVPLMINVKKVYVLKLATMDQDVLILTWIVTIILIVLLIVAIQLWVVCTMKMILSAYLPILVLRVVVMPQKVVVNTASLCNDKLKCTKDICGKDPIDSSKYKCSFPEDLGLCGILTSCQTASCGYDRDCLISYNDDLCPVHAQAPACLLPLCTPGTGKCSYQDICGASHPDCGGFDSCTCNPTLNKCVKTIPTKRSVENDNQSTIVVVDEMNGGQIMSVGIIYLFFILCLTYMINKL